MVDGRAAPARAAQLDADVWIPDDAAWTAAAGRLELAPKDTLGSGTVIATSPIFMVADTGTAARVQHGRRILAGAGRARRRTRPA